MARATFALAWRAFLQQQPYQPFGAQPARLATFDTLNITPLDYHHHYSPPAVTLHYAHITYTSPKYALASLINIPEPTDAYPTPTRVIIQW